MFFSRIQQVDATEPLTDRASVDPERDHRVLWSFFDDRPDRDRDFVYRKMLDEKRPTYNVVSEREPQDQSGWSVRTKEYDPVFEEGLELRFSVRINSVLQKDGTAHDVVMNRKYELRQEGREDEIPPEHELEYNQGLDWFKRREESRGFRVDEKTFQVQSHRTIRFDKKNGRKISLALMDTIGSLTVTDPMSFRDCALRGLGRSKVYGCGLLMLKPVRTKDTVPS